MSAVPLKITQQITVPPRPLPPRPSALAYAAKSKAEVCKVWQSAILSKKGVVSSAQNCLVSKALCLCALSLRFRAPPPTTTSPTAAHDCSRAHRVRGEGRMPCSRRRRRPVVALLRRRHAERVVGLGREPSESCSAGRADGHHDLLDPMQRVPVRRRSLCTAGRVALRSPPSLRCRIGLGAH